MHYFSSAILAIATLSLQTAMGAPRPETPGCAGGAIGWNYKVTSQKDVPGTPQVGDYSVSGASGGKPFRLMNFLNFPCWIHSSRTFHTCG